MRRGLIAVSLVVINSLVIAVGILFTALAWPVLAQPARSSAGVALPPASAQNGWSDFSPTGWITTPFTASVHVTDTAGLSLATARYSFSTDGGQTWSTWAAAAATGTISTAAVITTPLLSLADGLTNAVRFAISDTAAIPATDFSPVYPLLIGVAPPTSTIFLPLIVKGPSDTYELNDTRAGAYGPLVSGQTYESYIWSAADKWDCYNFDPSNLGAAVINLSSIPPGSDYDLYLYDSTSSTGSIASSRNTGASNEQITYNLQHASEYYLCVYAFSGWNNNNSYFLQATFP